MITLLDAQLEANDFATDMTVWDGKIYVYNVPERILMEVDPATGQSSRLPIPSGVNTNLRGDGWGVLPDGTFLSSWEFSTTSGQRRADTIMRHDFTVDPPQSEPWFHPAGNFGDLVFVPPNQVWGTERGADLVKFEVDPVTFEVVSRTNYGRPSSPDGGYSAVVSWSAHFPDHLIGLEESNGSGNGEMRLIDISVDPPVASAPIATTARSLLFFGAEMVSDSINMSCHRALELAISDAIDQPGSFSQVGDLITYTATVTNTGEIPLYDISLENLGLDIDSLAINDNADADADGQIDTLAPGASATITFSYSVTQADIDSGRVTLSASATGSTLVGLAVEDLSDDPDDLTNLDTEDDADPDDPTVSPLQGPPPPKPTATDDFRTGLPAGQAVTIRPLANDGSDLSPSSVRLIDPKTGEPSTSVETLEGTWTVDTATGDITFTPVAGFSGQPAPISYVVSTTDGQEVTQASIQLEFAPAVLAFTGGSTTTLIWAVALILTGFALQWVSRAAQPVARV